MDAHAVLTAVHEVLAGKTGQVRTVTTQAEPGVYEGVTDEQLGIDVLVRPRFEVTIARLERSRMLGPVTADRAIHELELVVRVAFATELEIDACKRVAVRAACIGFFEDCRRALTWPGNLGRTLAGHATGLIGEALEQRGPMRVTREAWARRLLVAEGTFLGLLLDDLPTS